MITGVKVASPGPHGGRWSRLPASPLAKPSRLPLAFTAGETLQLGRLSETDIAAARAFFGLRYWGAYMAAKYGSSGIRPGGSIVFTSGLAGTRPHAGWSLGASICSAMEGLTRALAVELAPIRVNIVSPGVVEESALGKHDGS